MLDFNPTKLILCGRKNILLTHLIKKRTKEGKKKEEEAKEQGGDQPIRTRREREREKKNEEIKNRSPTDESRSSVSAFGESQRSK